MLKNEGKSFATNPFVVTDPRSEKTKGTKVSPKKPGAHLSKDLITREVLNRIVDRVKRI
jgi:hypothetical protein